MRQKIHKRRAVEHCDLCSKRAEELYIVRKLKFDVMGTHHKPFHICPVCVKVIAEGYERGV